MPEARRIAVVTETYPPEINGVARTVGIMVHSLLSRGHRVQLVRPRQHREPAASPHPRLEEHLTRAVPLPKYYGLQLGLARAATLARRWREAPPDVVHVVTEGPLGWAAVTAAKRLGLPVTSDFHTNFHTYSRHYGFGWLGGLVARGLRRLHNRCDNTMVPTDDIRDQLAALGFKRLEIVGRGIDTRLFNIARRSAGLRASWGCKGDEPVVLHVGRLAAEKNLSLFGEAAEAMRSEDPTIRVVVVGDGPEAKRLKASRPEFHYAGMRHGEDLAAHYASADAFLFPSVTETFGNVTLEAMASGLAVVAYDYAAARQVIRDGENGLLARFDDRDGFIAAARRLAREPYLRATLGRAAHATASALTWERVVDDLEAALFTRPAGRADGVIDRQRPALQSR